MIEFAPEARCEALEAKHWYDRRAPALGTDFEAELSGALALVAAAPTRYPELLAGARYAMLPRFPYYVVFAARADRILVLAVGHASRAPGFWRNRRGSP